MSAGLGTTLVEVFNNRVTRTPDAVAMRTKRGGVWIPLTYAQGALQARELASGLVSLGVAPGTCVSLLSNNRAEWILCDVAVQLAAGRTAAIYATNSPRQVAHVIGDSGSGVVFVEDTDQLDKVLKVRDELPGLKTIVVISGEGADARRGVISYEELRRLGREHAAANPSALDERMALAAPDAVATLVYTSGTTGEPKGAMLTHDNFVRTVEAGVAVMNLDDRQEHRLISYLPLSHIFERLIGEWVCIYLGGEVWFAESIDKLAANLKECRPTLFVGVPRVYEKFYAGVRANVAKQPPVKRILVTKAIAAGQATVALEQAHKPIPARVALLHRLLDHLVLSKLRHEMGMDACRLAVSGAAPLSAEVLTFVLSLGIRLVEGYGLTETTAPVSVNPYTDIRAGTVGLPLPGTEVRFDPDGELLVRGYNVFKGYFSDEAATAAAFSDDGFFRTGDVGEFDADGYIRITDRLKDIIVTAGGKNVAPQVLEERLKSDPLISQAVVVGDRRPYLVALITLDPEAAPKWAADHQIAFSDAGELAASPLILQAVGAAVERVNAGLSRVEGIKKWTVLDRDFTLDAEEITPSLKVRRKVIMEKYNAAIDRMYT